MNWLLFGKSDSAKKHQKEKKQRPKPSVESATPKVDKNMLKAKSVFCLRSRGAAVLCICAVVKSIQRQPKLCNRLIWNRGQNMFSQTRRVLLGHDIAIHRLMNFRRYDAMRTA